MVYSGIPREIASQLRLAMTFEGEIASQLRLAMTFEGEIVSQKRLAMTLPETQIISMPGWTKD